MKQSTYILMLLVIFSCKSAIVQNNPKNIFQGHLKVIERLFNGEKIYDLKSSILFLEEITGVQSEIDYGIEIMYSPTEQNLKDWKDWYKKNKNLLYWDDKEQKVRVRL